jgi:hypothetical protein
MFQYSEENSFLFYSRKVHYVQMVKCHMIFRPPHMWINIQHLFEMVGSTNLGLSCVVS